MALWIIIFNFKKNSLSFLVLLVSFFPNRPIHFAQIRVSIRLCSMINFALQLLSFFEILDVFLHSVHWSVDEGGDLECCFALQIQREDDVVFAFIHRFGFEEVAIVFENKFFLKIQIFFKNFFENFFFLRIFLRFFGFFCWFCLEKTTSKQSGFGGWDLINVIERFIWIMHLLKCVC